MDTQLSLKLKKIQLTRSEPVIGINKLCQKTENRHTVKYCDANPALTQAVRMPYPPVHSQPKGNIKSIRCFKLPIHSLRDLQRCSADDNSRHSDEKKNTNDLNRILEMTRLPGDGCNSSSIESTESSENSDDNDFEYTEDNQIDGNIDIESDNDSEIGLFDQEVSLSSSFATEETLSVLSSSPMLRLHSSKVLLKDSPPWPLLQSLFPNTPPTLYFTVNDEEISHLPVKIRKVMKWKHSTVTPKVVKACVSKSGFNITKGNNDWLGVWGKHMKSLCFKSIKEHQKINHFPGSFHIGRKDKLWSSFMRMRILHGKKEFNFLPQTYILPQDFASLKKAWDDTAGKNKWIVKPPASARGIGIRVISKWSQVPKKRLVVVQKYLAQPYLINDCKFDLRIYVLVTSYDPLRVYIFQDGLVRFATKKYSASSKSLSNRFIHLTNYSVNKQNVVYSTTDNTAAGQEAHKWSIKYLWVYLQKRGINTSKIWDSIKDIATKAIICGDSAVNGNMKQNVKNRRCCYELFGLDILLDHSLKPWLLEVNISPSLHSSSELDKIVKGQLVKDVLNMAGFLLPRQLLLAVSGASPIVKELGADSFWFNQRTLSTDERSKHVYYIQQHDDLAIKATILDLLTPDDLLILMETEDELSRCGEFERLMPSSGQSSYLNFFENPRYYNLLLDEWIKQKTRDDGRGSYDGINMLQKFANKGIHLQHGNYVSRNHQWNTNTSRNGIRSVPLKSRSARTKVLSTSTSTLSKSTFRSMTRNEQNMGSYSLCNKASGRDKRVASLTCKFPRNLDCVDMKRSSRESKR